MKILLKKNKKLAKKYEQEKKEREELEKHLSKIQEEQGHAVGSLQKKLARHVRDMHTWKDYLEQDKEYNSIDLHITMAEDLKGDPFDEKLKIVGEAFTEETSLLAKLLNDKNGGSPKVEEKGESTVSPRAKKQGRTEKSEKSPKK